MKRTVACLIFLTTLGLNLFTGTTAEACGYWTLFDHELDRRVRFGPMSMSMDSLRDRSARLILGLGGRTPNLHVRVIRGTQLREALPKEISLEGGTILRRGKPVGEVKGDQVILAGRHYQIKIGPGSKRGCATGQPVTILIGDKVIAESRGERHAMIPCGTSSKAINKAADITRRLVLYLTWREQFLDEVQQQIVKSKASQDPLGVLQRDLRGSSWSKRLKSALVLAALGEAAAPVLVETFEKSRSTKVRLEALFGLRRLGAVAAPFVPRLIKARRAREEVYVRTDLCKTVAAMGDRSTQAIAALKSWFKDANPGVRNAAAQGLGSMGASEEIITALVAALKDRSHNVRRSAVTALGKLASQAKGALPAIKKLLDDEDEEVIRAAGEAIRRIDI